MSNRWAKAQDLGLLLGTPPALGLPAWALEPERTETVFRWPPRVSQAAFDFEIATIMATGEGTTLELLRVQPQASQTLSRQAREAFRLRLFKKQNGQCHWCCELMDIEHKTITTRAGKVKNNNTYASFEHLIPRAMGGRFTEENIRLAHAGCNCHRQDKNHLPRYAHDPLREVVGS